MQTTCPSCGELVEENAKFCPNCGAQQPRTDYDILSGSPANSVEQQYGGQQQVPPFSNQPPPSYSPQQSYYPPPAPPPPPPPPPPYYEQQPPYQQNPYGQQFYPPQYTGGQTRNTLALGIVSILGAVFFPIAGWVCSIVGLVQSGRNGRTGYPDTRGTILSGIGLGLTILTTLGRFFSSLWGWFW